MIDQQAIAEARRELGRRLAACREAAGLTQGQLASVIHFGRSSVANAETGYSTCSRTFWEHCDQALGTNGVLIRAYNDFRAFVRRRRAETAKRVEIDRRSRMKGLPAASGHVPEHHESSGSGTTVPVAVHSPAHFDEIMVHLRDQWHALVRTDNLLGPRFALAGVRNQIAVIDALLVAVDNSLRLELVRLGAQYAESAAWLYEDANDLARSRYWLGRAMEWAYEADDRAMLAWTAYRGSHQAAWLGDSAKAVALARAARREEQRWPTPMRAAVRVQEARGRALAGQCDLAQRLLDEAHAYAAMDTAGDARGGHGSFCTPSYIEISRADCLVAAGKPMKAIPLYEQALSTLPTVYQRDRAVGLTRLAAAYSLNGQPEQAASAAYNALPAARGAGSRRIMHGLHGVGAALEPHRGLASVAAFLDDLHRGEAG